MSIPVTDHDPKKRCCVCTCRHTHFENQNPYATGPGRLVTETADNCPVEGHKPIGATS